MTDLRHATLDDLFITRDKAGDIVPIEIESALLGGIVSLVPTTYGYIKRKGLDMKVSAVDWPTDAKLEFIQTHIVTPDVSGLTVQDIEERMGPMTLNHLVSLVVSQSVPMKRLHQDIAPLVKAVKSVLSKNDSKTPNTSSTKSGIPT